MAHFLKLFIVSSPLGFLYLPKPDHVCRLQKVLYGLKQASRGRFKWFADHLYNFNFLGSKSDTSLFDNRRGFDMPNLLLYVDDIILTALSVFVLFTITAALCTEFGMKDLGPLHSILCITITRHSSGYPQECKDVRLQSLSDPYGYKR